MAYEKVVQDLIGQRWYNLMKRNAQVMALGTLHVSFSISPDGRIENLRTISNSPNRNFETASCRLIESARIPPIPLSVLKDLPNHRLQEEISFRMFPN